MDFSMNIQNKLVEKLHENFQEEEQRWYAANLYIYMKFHPTEDFPINLDDIYSMIGFANKENAKRTLVNNFTRDIDFKVYEGQEVKAARPKGRTDGTLHKNINPDWEGKQTILLNTETFKNLCMIARTEKGKKIRAYYVKLETITVASL
jgi:phage anti-repressor protein